MAAWTSRSSRSSTSSSASYARSLPPPRAGRTTSRPCGGAATCCAILRPRSSRASSASPHIEPAEPRHRLRLRRRSFPRHRDDRFAAAPASDGGARLRRRGADRIDPPLGGKRLEAVGDAEHRLGAAEIEEAVIGHDLTDALEHPGLGLLVEVNKDVAAEDDVEAAEDARVVEQVEFPELHHRPDRRVDLPALAVLLEVLHEEADRETALHLELRIDSGFRLGQDVPRDVRGDDLVAPAAQLGRVLAQQHGDGIGLLPARGGRAPDAEAAARRARLDQVRQDQRDELVEGLLVAKEERLVRRHRIDDIADESLAPARAQGANELVEILEAVIARHRDQPVLEQVALVLADDEARALAQEAAEILEIVRLHIRPSSTNFCTKAGISPTGRMAAQMPAWAATVPPESARVRAPLRPSCPIPVRTRTRTLPPQASARLRSIGSAAGRQKFSGGPLSSLAMRRPPLFSPSKWKSPGAI